MAAASGASAGLSGLFGKSKKKSFKPTNLNAEAPAAPPKPPPPPAAPAPPAEPPAGEEAWQTEMRLQDEVLRKRGYYIRPIEADGNCFFRSVADQLGQPDDHALLREQCVDHLAAHREEFEPFLDTEEESFDSYIAGMRELKTWAGQLEIQALSRVLGVNVLIRRLNEAPTEHVLYDEDHRLIHISYHSGEHYNSVRPLTEEENANRDCCTTLREVKQRDRAVEEEEARERAAAEAEAKEKEKYGNMTELKMKK